MRLRGHEIDHEKEETRVALCRPDCFVFTVFRLNAEKCFIVLPASSR